MKSTTDISKISNPNSPTKYYRAAEERHKKSKNSSHEITDRDRLLMEQQRQRMIHRDLIDRGVQALDEDSQLCQEYYVSSNYRLGMPFDVDAIVDLMD